MKILELNQKNTNHFIYDISKAKKELKFKPKIQVSKKILKSWLENSLS